MKSLKGVNSKSFGADLEIHIFVSSRLMVSVKINYKCKIFSNYQIATTIRVDNFVDRAFCKKW